MTEPSWHETQKVQYMTTATMERVPAAAGATEGPAPRSIDLEFASAREVHAGLDGAN